MWCGVTTHKPHLNSPASSRNSKGQAQRNIYKKEFFLFGEASQARYSAGDRIDDLNNASMF
jgi:hypothetical protein